MSKPAIPAPHLRTPANRKRASTIIQEKRKRFSKAEALVGWDQLKIGVRSSITGAFVDSDGEEFQFEDSDYDYQSGSDSDEGLSPVKLTAETSLRNQHGKPSHLLWDDPKVNEQEKVRNTERFQI